VLQRSLHHRTHARPGLRHSMLLFVAVDRVRLQAIVVTCLDHRGDFAIEGKTPPRHTPAVPLQQPSTKAMTQIEGRPTHVAVCDQASPPHVLACVYTPMCVTGVHSILQAVF
jgi:hypothetical protein